MAKNSIIALTGDGVTTQWTVNFTGGYMDESHVTCQVNGEVDGSQQPVYRPLTFISPGLIEVGGGAAGVGEEVLFRRTTPITSPINDFSGNAQFSSENVDLSFQQVLFGAQEAADNLADQVDIELTLAQVTAMRDETQVDRDAADASAAAAATSETNAAASAAAAATSETNAGNSETAATTAATNAATSETNAGNSATAAANSETAAGNSETAAATSATNAATSETNAGNSATAAATSETNAGNSETAAGNSATAAATSETNAANSETNAATSETNAAASALEAESVAIAMAIALG